MEKQKNQSRYYLIILLAIPLLIATFKFSNNVIIPAITMFVIAVVAYYLLKSKK